MYWAAPSGYVCQCNMFVSFREWNKVLLVEGTGDLIDESTCKRGGVRVLLVWSMFWYVMVLQELPGVQMVSQTSGQRGQYTHPWKTHHSQDH